jgi:hypothetical protein
MNDTKLTEIISDESFKLKPLKIDSFSVEFSEMDGTITLFVNHRKTAVVFDKGINKYDEILSTVNRLINSWRSQ